MSEQELLDLSLQAMNWRCLDAPACLACGTMYESLSDTGWTGYLSQCNCDDPRHYKTQLAETWNRIYTHHLVSYRVHE